MASNYNRKSASSGSRKQPSRTRASASGKNKRSSTPAPRPSGRVASRSSSSRRSTSASQQQSYRAVPGGRYPANSKRPQQRLSSVRVGDLERSDRSQRAQKTHRRYLVRIIIALCVVASLVIGAAVAYSSNLFTIENITVKGAEHLTTADMTEMAAVPANTTLLRVDAAGIRQRMLQNSWVLEVKVNRVFPNTLELAVTERSIVASVEVPTEDAKAVKQWAIASDHMWLMPVPSKDSEAGKNTSPKIYEDLESALTITDVPYNTQAKIGTLCTDENVNNALDIVSNMTTELSDRVVSVSAAGPEETTLELDDGIVIAFGKAQDIRDKERVCLKVMEENPDAVYINVRVVDRPTWRSL